MPTQILMPALSPTMTEGKLAKWLKEEGDTVKPGRRARRDRDRQGDHGGRGGRRRPARARSWCPKAPRASRSTRRSRVLLAEGEDVPTLDRRQRRRPRRRARRRAAAGAGAARQRPANGAAPVPRRRRRSRDAGRHDDDKMTVREALRDAMAEEMRRDPDVFLMGEEVARVSGRLQGQPGPARGVRRRSA